MIGLDQSGFIHKLKPPSLWVETKQNQLFLTGREKWILNEQSECLLYIILEKWANHMHQ